MPADKSMLDFYWKLASDDKDERVAAAVGLLESLRRAESQEDWDYALKRLVRGLSSSHGSSRLGFCMALAELLEERKKHISFNQYLMLSVESFKVPGNATGPEERGLCFGLLFALQTLIRSPILTEKTTKIDDYVQWLDILLDLADRKSLLRESCFFTLCEAVDRLVRENGPIDTEAAIAVTLEKVEAKAYTITSEGVALYLTIPDELRTKYGSGLAKGWKFSDPLSRGNLPLLSKALREIPAREDQKQKGSWKPSLHFVWPKLLQLLMSRGDQSSEPPKKKHKKHSSKSTTQASGEEGRRVSLEDVWKVVVEEGMFSVSASQERKYWGFEIFNLFIRQSGKVNALLTGNFVRTLAAQLATPDKILNKQAKRSTEAIEEDVSAHRGHALKVIKAVFEHSPHFDRVSKTKFVENLIPLVPADKLLSLVDLFFSTFMDPRESEPKAIDMRRQWAIDSLVHLVKSRTKIDGEEAATTEWIDSIIDNLVRFGYFLGNELVFPLSDHSINVCQTRLNSIMTATIGRKRPDGKSWAFYTFDKIHAYEEAGESLRTPFEGELARAKDKSIGTLYKIRNRRTASKHSDNGQLEAFELLFALVLLQVYSVDSEAGSILEELQMVYNTVIGRANVGETGDKTELDAGQVLTEILISFLSRKSALLRVISQDIFATFSSQMTADSLQLLYDVLATRESEEGQKDLFEDDGDEDLESDVESLVDDKGTGVGEDHVNEAAEVGSDDDGDENDEDDADEDEDEDEDDDDGDVDDVVEETEQKTKVALAKALGVPASDDEDDDEESMDDEQMMALDSQLAAIFSERRDALASHKPRSQKKKDAQQAKENIIQLKMRVVDLLDVYVRNEPSNPLIMSAIMPLLSLLRFTKSKQLGEKAHSLLKGRLCRIRVLPQLQDSDAVMDLVGLLADVHKEAQRSTNKAHSLAANQCSVFISKVLLRHDKNTAKDISQIFASTLSTWIEKPSSKVTPALFFDFVNFASAFRQKKD